MKIKLRYGVDPDPGPHAFYWPDSPSKRKELLSVKRNHPATFESVYQCRPGKREGSIFLESDFVEYLPPSNLSAGISDPEVRNFCSRFHAIICSWDTAIEATHESDHTVGLAAGLLPCEEYHRGEDPAIYGPCEPHLDVYLLDLVRKKVQWGDLVSEFRSFNRKWTPQLHVVEKKASGIQLYQAMSSIGISIEGEPANTSKYTRAVSGTEAGSTQGWFRQWRVRTPRGAPWAEAYKVEMKDFTGDDDSEDDQVDATVHLTNYAIRSGGQIALMSSDWRPENVDKIISDQESLPDPSLAYVPPRAELLSWLQMAPEFSADPFAEHCVACLNNINGYCRVQKRRVIDLDQCEHFFARAGASDEDVRAAMA